jgi:citrate lyase synthetase
MNERIKELVEKSFIYDKQNDSSFFNKEKFAELIVAECVGIVENLSPGYKDYRDQIEDAFRRDCVIEIKKHFGVE